MDHAAEGVAGQLGDGEAEQETASADDAENLQGLELGAVQGGPDKDIEEGTGDQGDDQEGSYKLDVHIISV